MQRRTLVPLAVTAAAAMGRPADGELAGPLNPRAAGAAEGPGACVRGP